MFSATRLRPAQETHELDPEKSDPKFRDSWFPSEAQRQRRDRRFARVMHTLQDHLLAISREHKKVRGR